MRSSCAIMRIPLLAGLVVLIGPQLSAGQTKSPHYHYFDQEMPLTCDDAEVAVFDKTGESGPSVVLSRGIAGVGISADAVRPSPVPSLYFAQTPAGTKDEQGVKELSARILETKDVEFVSPVLRDERGEPVIITQHIHVGFHDGVSANQAEEILAELRAGVIVERHWAGMKGVYRLSSESNDGFAVLDKANELAARAEVKFAEPDMILKTTKSLIPDDPYFPNLWGLHNTGQSGGTVDMDMDGPEAWDITTGDPSIIVVILDDGVEQTHPDINQIPGADFTGMGTNGGPYNVCDNHGTTVAGCTSAIINNGLGVTGIAPGCKVAAAKWSVSDLGTPCPGTGWFYISWLVNAIDWAQTIGARVTNNSNSMGSSSSITNKYLETYNNGIVHFAATGNSGGSGIGYPSSLPTVNAVGANNRYGNRAYFSTYGTGIAFVAPGQTIGTTDRTGSAGYFGGDYGYVDGTSYSSPYAAGVAAMVLSVNDQLTAAEVGQIMNDTCMDRGAAGYDIYYGWGIVNAHAAMLAASPGVTLEGYCFYDEAMQEPVNTVTVDVLNLDTSASWAAATTDNYYTLDLQAGSDIHADDTLRLIAKDGGNWINVTDHVVTQPEINAGSIYIDLILDEFYLDLADFPMYEADSPEDQMCGPAVAQMTLNYMFWDSTQDPTPPMTFDDQSVLYDYGIANNETPGLDYLDMLGMWHTIQDYRPVPYSQYGYNFSRRHDTDSAAIIKQIAQWIAYPIGTYGGHEEGHPEHVPGVIPAYGNYTNWMAVRGIHTSENAYPLPPEMDVYGFWVNDPYPASLGGIGENSYKTIDEFLATYYLPLTTGDSYDGEYVAICEPPETLGDENVVYVPSPDRFSAEAAALIATVQSIQKPPEDMVSAANAWIIQAAIEGVSEQLIPYDDAFAGRFAGTVAADPLFVHSDNGDDYYAVPFDVTIGTDSLESAGVGTAVVILIDGTEGNFKEAAWVSSPVEYLPVSERDAYTITYEMLKKYGIDPVYIKTAIFELVHRGSTPYYPDWHVFGKGFEIYIGQDGAATLVNRVEVNTG
ncbi:MAG: S8 family serine peptidase [Phycisphaerales bacterium]|nr:MAG: S8 family serine peptidase [Phycisphaerales bacterium]